METERGFGAHGFDQAALLSETAGQADIAQSAVVVGSGHLKQIADIAGVVESGEVVDSGYIVEPVGGAEVHLAVSVRFVDSGWVAGIVVLEVRLQSANNIFSKELFILRVTLLSVLDILYNLRGTL